jgi:hypothetical protein
MFGCISPVPEWMEEFYSYSAFKVYQLDQFLVTPCILAPKIGASHMGLKTQNGGLKKCFKELDLILLIYNYYLPNENI